MLLRSLMLLRFLLPEKSQYVRCKQFLIFFEAKEAVEVIEASDVIMSDEVIEATEAVRTT